jgi:hypothetical protein
MNLVNGASRAPGVPLRLLALSLDQLQSPLDPTEPLIEAVHPPVERSKLHENLAGVFLDRTQPHSMVRHGFAQGVDARADVPELFKHEIADFFGHLAPSD